MKNCLALPTALLLFISTAGFANADPPARNLEATVLRLDISDIRFVPMTLQAPFGKPLVLEVRNNGKEEHNLVIPDLNIYTYNLRSGERIKLRLQVDKRGIFRFYSDAPGYPEANLSGRISIQ
ncbi:cupredoxin domain-containing protein [Effusibacillus lacus]|uniref:cupredoxin domain-containing protein n=1 Tax=Effusibacillus lacus TaxID=1348429 RepID=UPI000BB98A29|nr:cupredoxin domain-containing protein [Effusibacillus lacus]TCS68590.1 cupredoxin-like protein [Effusibacillus lacus]